jgi:hypothetical protein
MIRRRLPHGLPSIPEGYDGRRTPTGATSSGYGMSISRKADQSDSLRGNEQCGVGDEVARVPDLAGIPDCGIEGGAVANRRLGMQIGRFGKGERSAGYVLSQGDACGVIPFGQEKLDEGAAEGNA